MHFPLGERYPSWKASRRQFARVDVMSAPGPNATFVPVGV